MEQQKTGRTAIVSFHIPVHILNAIDKLVEMGVFNSRSEAIRLAIYNLLREYSALNSLSQRLTMLGR